jgi:hypothetical protein
MTPKSGYIQKKNVYLHLRDLSSKNPVLEDANRSRQVLKWYGIGKAGFEMSFLHQLKKPDFAKYASDPNSVF